jgi:hypothetical protein
MHELDVANPSFPVEKSGAEGAWHVRHGMFNSSRKVRTIRP